MDKASCIMFHRSFPSEAYSSKLPKELEKGAYLCISGVLNTITLVLGNINSLKYCYKTIWFVSTHTWVVVTVFYIWNKMFWWVFLKWIKPNKSLFANFFFSFNNVSIYLFFFNLHSSILVAVNESINQTTYNVTYSVRYSISS